VGIRARFQDSPAANPGRRSNRRMPSKRTTALETAPAKPVPKRAEAPAIRRSQAMANPSPAPTAGPLTADQQQHQIPAIHSMTSSARASSECGISTPYLSRHLEVEGQLELGRLLGRRIARRGIVTETGSGERNRVGCRHGPARLSPPSVPARDHPARDLALSPVHPELPPMSRNCWPSADSTSPTKRFGAGC
jgi:hypothetical protein